MNVGDVGDWFMGVVSIKVEGDVQYKGRLLG